MSNTKKATLGKEERQVRVNYLKQKIASAEALRLELENKLIVYEHELAQIDENWK